MAILKGLDEMTREELLAETIETLTQEELRDLVQIKRGGIAVVAGTLPCPCCGGVSRVHNEVGPDDWMVCCTVCDLNSRCTPKPQECVALWNRREGGAV